MSLGLHELQQITLDVWETFLGVRPEEVAQRPLGAGTLAVRVRITGAWDGTVLLRMSPALARRVGEEMFAKPAEVLSDEELRDAVGEIGNMVAGNLKGLLAEEARLSLPSVAEWYLPEEPRNGSVIATVDLLAFGEQFRVLLLQKA
ncbi:MAG: chemotaxis protein CheX [Gemmatimonadales bacterium]